ncbi:hypothetical protein [Tsukamurella soli]|uniref:Uncharacterized protein n=1 Tax=Tsukamurella soli TaxID=644556 RepID=A0ABP8K956_9ACTN
MSFRHRPTYTNVLASRELIPGSARALMRTIATATEALNRIAVAESGDPATVVAAVAAWKRAQDQINAYTDDLLGLAVLGGAAVSTTARATGQRPETLATRLAASPAASLRGLDLVRVGDEWVVDTSAATP